MAQFLWTKFHLVVKNAFFPSRGNLWKGEIYGSGLSNVLDILSVMVFSFWYTPYITWYTRYIISNTNFTFWKAWYNVYKWVIPAISHEKRNLTKTFFSRSPLFPCHITGIRQYPNVIFVQSKVLLFWRCRDFLDLLWNLPIGWRR